MDRKRLIWVSGVIVGYAAAYAFWRNIALFDPNVGEWAASNFLIPAALIGVITAFFQKYWFTVISFTGFNAGIVIGGLHLSQALLYNGSQTEKSVPCRKRAERGDI